MFDGLQNNWEEVLSTLCYMSSHMREYQTNLNQMLSDVDKEIQKIPLRQHRIIQNESKVV